MEDKAGMDHLEDLESPKTSTKPSYGAKVKAHLKKWWWAHLIFFIAALLIIVLCV